MIQFPPLSRLLNAIKTPNIALTRRTQKHRVLFQIFNARYQEKVYIGIDFFLALLKWFLHA